MSGPSAVGVELAGGVLVAGVGARDEPEGLDFAIGGVAGAEVDGVGAGVGAKAGGGTGKAVAGIEPDGLDFAFGGVVGIVDVGGTGIGGADSVNAGGGTGEAVAGVEGLDFTIGCVMGAPLGGAAATLIGSVSAGRRGATIAAGGVKGVGGRVGGMLGKGAVVVVDDSDKALVFLCLSSRT